MLTPMKAIRAKCLECSAGNANEVKLCPITACPLFPYRFGKNPNVKRERTAAQLEALRNGRLALKHLDKPNGFSENSVAEGTYTPATENAVERFVSPA